jgi:hypothetical protein
MQLASGQPGNFFEILVFFVFLRVHFFPPSSFRAWCQCAAIAAQYVSVA